jgi:hypothetical protein
MVSLFIFYVFSSTKIRKQEGRTGSAWGRGGGLGTTGRGEVVGKGLEG